MLGPSAIVTDFAVDLGTCLQQPLQETCRRKLPSRQCHHFFRHPLSRLVQSERRRFLPLLLLMHPPRKEQTAAPRFPAAALPFTRLFVSRIRGKNFTTSRRTLFDQSSKSFGFDESDCQCSNFGKGHYFQVESILGPLRVQSGNQSPCATTSSSTSDQICPRSNSAPVCGSIIAA